MNHLYAALICYNSVTVPKNSNWVSIPNTTSSSASIDTIFVSFHTAVQKCKSVQIRGIEPKSNCMSWLFVVCDEQAGNLACLVCLPIISNLKSFSYCIYLFNVICQHLRQLRCFWLAPFYLAGSSISAIWITLVKFKIVWFECRHLWFYWWIRDPLKGWRGSRVGWWCEACRHREFPAFDGWIAVVQQVLESIRIFVGGDAKIQVRLAVNLYISIGFRF